MRARVCSKWDLSVGPGRRRRRRSHEITNLEAVRFRSVLVIQGIAPNWMWVRVHTDKGLVGIGESYPGYDAHRGALKELAPVILGKDALPAMAARLSRSRN
jgi:L-alanine-DL-glutamate epimerase-like enolase superfamily enzyme